MSNDLNYCSFIGNLGKDVDLRYTSDGKPIANFSIAVGESWKDKSGQKQEKTTWVNIVIFGSLAAIAGEYLKKGSKVFISGKMQVRQWDDNSGNKRYSTEVVISQFSGKMQMLSSAESKPKPAQPAQQPKQDASQEFLDDDLDGVPF